MRRKEDKTHATIYKTFVGALIFFAGSGRGQSNPPPPDTRDSPFGIVSSGTSYKTYPDWFPKMSAAGITWARMLPPWGAFEPARGDWNFEKGDMLFKTADGSHIHISADLLFSAPWVAKARAFPMKNLDDWGSFVSKVVDRYKDRTQYWEVWNEGNGGFNANHNTTADYAALVSDSYAAARKIDPNARVGISVASFDLPYIEQTIRAQARAGHAGSFDFLCIHPYETVGGFSNANGEIAFLWMTRLLRDMLKSAAPEKANAEIWITEVGRRVGNKRGVITADDAAKSLVKIYTMAIAQGIRKVMWFEGQDPIGEADGYGLLDTSGNPRPAYHAMKTMTGCLGPTPRYQGWLALGAAGNGYGFVFDGASGPVLVAWMPLGAADSTLTFTADVRTVGALADASATLAAHQPLALSDTPVFVMGVPADLLKQAKENATKNFPWGGDYTNETTVGIQLGPTTVNHGIMLYRSGIDAHVFPDGSAGAKMLTAEAPLGGKSILFTVHPSFATINTHDYYLRVTARRLTPRQSPKSSPRIKLVYEIADSKGGKPYVYGSEPFELADDPGVWQTHTWHITDACFSKMWGFDFELRIDGAEPFVIGSAEVSTKAF